MNTSARIFGILVWLGGLAVAGSVILVLTAARVGEHKSSTYGYAYFLFQEGWGGEIGIVPPEFTLQRNYTESQFNKDAGQYEEVKKTERYSLVPRSISIDSTIDYGEQERDLLIFNAFEAYNEETYTIINNTEYAGELLVKVTKPENANLLYDYTVSVPSQNGLVVRPDMGKPVVLLPSLSKGGDATIIITYSTKGMDVFKYNLSAYQNNVIQGLSGNFKLNTHDFEIYRFGLPHDVNYSADDAEIKWVRFI